jgi:hypothetical protein
MENQRLNGSDRQMSSSIKSALFPLLVDCLTSLSIDSDDVCYAASSHTIGHTDDACHGTGDGFRTYMLQQRKPNETEPSARA